MNCAEEDCRSDQDFIQHVYETYGQLTLDYIWGKVHNERVAEDLAQEVFCRFIENLDKFVNEGQPVHPWLYRVAHNIVIDHFRKERRLFFPEPREDGEDPFTMLIDQKQVVEAFDDDVCEEVDAELLAYAILSRLDPQEREALVLKDCNKLTFREMVDAMELRNISHAKQLYYSALAKARQIRKELSSETE